jgi:hypothetical protein
MQQARRRPDRIQDHEHCLPIENDSLTSIVAMKHVAVSGHSQIRATNHQNSLGEDSWATNWRQSILRTKKPMQSLECPSMVLMLTVRPYHLLQLAL